MVGTPLLTSYLADFTTKQGFQGKRDSLYYSGFVIQPGVKHLICQLKFIISFKAVDTVGFNSIHGLGPEKNILQWSLCEKY